MKRRSPIHGAGSLLGLTLLLAACASQPSREWQPGATAALPSWREGAARSAVLDFVARTTDPASPRYVPPADRVAVFDNDGTLWSEQPYYFQLAFVLDRLQKLAPEHPEWSETEPFRSALAGDLPAVMAGGHEALFALVGATHSGMTVPEFESIVRRWFRDARHPGRNVGFGSLTYTPMVELLDLLRAHDFDVWIVTGGGIGFVRAVSEELYGVPADRVVGSRMELGYEERGGIAEVVRGQELAFVNDGPGKPVGIAEHIGRLPILAVGNSDGDYQMLRYTTDGRSNTMGVLIHHTDAEREWAYDRSSSIGHLERGLDEAAQRGWLVVDMARDWERIHPR